MMMVWHIWGVQVSCRLDQSLRECVPHVFRLQLTVKSYTEFSPRGLSFKLQISSGEGNLKFVIEKFYRKGIRNRKRKIYSKTQIQIQPIGFQYIR